MGNILNLINIKTVVAVLIVAILVAAIPVTTRLTQKQTQLKSRAASNWQCNTESGEYRYCIIFENLSGGSITVGSTVGIWVVGGQDDKFPRLEGTLPIPAAVSFGPASNCGPPDSSFKNCWEFNISNVQNKTYTETFASEISDANPGSFGRVQGSFTPVSSTGGGSCTLPLAPTGLKFDSSNQNTLSWNAVSGATSYNVRVNDLNINKEYAYDNISNTWYTLPTSILVGGHSYSWWVHSVNSCGGSPPASGSNFTISGNTGNTCPDDEEYCDTDTNQKIHKHGGYWDGSQCIYAFDVIGQCNQGGIRPIDQVPVSCKTSQTCVLNGKDTSCPTGSQWCYDGFCINDNYDPATKTCQAPPTTCVSPGPVTNLRPVNGTEYPAGKRTVTLQWDKPTTGGLVGHYNVRLDDPTTTGSADKEPDVQANGISSTSLEVPDLDNPTLYSWWVDAVSSCGAQPSRAGASFSIAGGTANVNYWVEGNVLNDKSNPVGGATICLDPPANDTTCSSTGLLKSTTSSTDSVGLISGKYHIDNIPPSASGHNVYITPPEGYTVTSENPVLINSGGISQNRVVGFTLKSKTSGQTCEQTVTKARNVTTNECKDFPTTCLDAGWVADPSCTTTTLGGGTACYIATEDLLERNNFKSCQDPKATSYNKHPESFTYIFAGQTPGTKTIFVRFIGNDGTQTDDQKQIVYKPTAALTDITCSYASEGAATKILITGNNLGSHSTGGPGGITVGGKKTNWTWGEGTVEILQQFPERLQSETEILVQPDGGSVLRGKCAIDLSTLGFNAEVQCRPPGNLGSAGVRVDIYENQATLSGTPRPIITQNIVIDKDGLPTSFTPQLESGKSYTLIIKAPGTVARKAVFIASQGTVYIPKVVTLPVGDIFPATRPDGVINPNDYSDLIRQWCLTGSCGARSGDFNLDLRVNSIDYACMRQNLDSSSPTHQDEGILSPEQTNEFNSDSINLVIKGIVAFDDKVGAIVESDETIKGAKVKLLRVPNSHIIGNILTADEIAQSQILAQAVTDANGNYTLQFTVIKGSANISFYVEPSIETNNLPAQLDAKLPIENLRGRSNTIKSDGGINLIVPYIGSLTLK